MKNLMGIVKNRMEYHLTGLDQCIARLLPVSQTGSQCCRCLSRIDEPRVEVRTFQSAIRQRSNEKDPLMSRDIVAVDAAAAKIFRKDLTTSAISKSLTRKEPAT